MNKKELNKIIDKTLKNWSNQKVTITCTMHEAGDLMDILYMADGWPDNDYFKNTLKLNKMTKSYNTWLNRMTDIVTGKKDGKSFRIQQNKK